jgi:hypothetical protein
MDCEKGKNEKKPGFPIKVGGNGCLVEVFVWARPNRLNRAAMPRPASVSNYDNLFLFSVFRS